MDIKTLRRAHLGMHVAQFKTAEAFLKHLNDGLQALDETPLSSSFLSQLRVGKPKGRDIGDEVARKLERGLHLPETAFDQPLPTEVSDLEREALAIVERWKALPPERRAAAKQAIEAFSQDLPGS